jgi:hypothetical protein
MLIAEAGEVGTAKRGRFAHRSVKRPLEGKGIHMFVNLIEANQSVPVDIVASIPSWRTHTINSACDVIPIS